MKTRYPKVGEIWILEKYSKDYEIGLVTKICSEDNFPWYDCYASFLDRYLEWMPMVRDC